MEILKCPSEMSKANSVQTNRTIWTLDWLSNRKRNFNNNKITSTLWTLNNNKRGIILLKKIVTCKAMTFSDQLKTQTHQLKVFFTF